jgi:lipoprotein-anchoring transpeptidase ErfK/SrfK
MTPGEHLTPGERLSGAFARSVAMLRPEPDPYGRLVHRYRRQNRRRVLVGAAVLVVLAVAGALLIPGLAGGSTLPTAVPAMSPWVQKLLTSPVRGSLAADVTYVSALRQAAQARTAPALAGIPAAQNQVTPLFVGDVGRLRIGLVAFHDTADVTAAWLVGAAGTGAVSLAGEVQVVLDEPGPLPVLRVAAGPGNLATEQALVAVAPADCQLDVSTDVSRSTWTPAGSYVAETRARTADWWRVRCAGAIRYEGPPTHEAVAGQEPPVGDAAVAAAVAGARGSPDADATRRALRLLSELTFPALSGAGRALWGGRLPGAVAGEQPVAVVTAPLEGGGWLVAVAHQPGGGRLVENQDFVFGTTVPLDDPGALFAIVVPAYHASHPSHVLVLAPVEATTAVAVDRNGRELSRAALTGGVGPVSVPDATVVTLRALAASGTVLSSYTPGAKADVMLAPTVNDW